MIIKWTPTGIYSTSYRRTRLTLFSRNCMLTLKLKANGLLWFSNSLKETGDSLFTVQNVFGIRSTSKMSPDFFSISNFHCICSELMTCETDFDSTSRSSVIPYSRLDEYGSTGLVQQKCHQGTNLTKLHLLKGDKIFGGWLALDMMIISKGRQRKGSDFSSRLNITGFKSCNSNFLIFANMKRYIVSEINIFEDKSLHRSRNSPDIPIYVYIRKILGYIQEKLYSKTAFEL